MRLTKVFKAVDLADLKNFPASGNQLAILERELPHGATDFFERLLEKPLDIRDFVRKECAEEDIRSILEDQVSDQIKQDPFYDIWIADMAQVCVSFCDTHGEDRVEFHVNSKRGSPRYHIDGIPMRALVTYTGTGTEWIPDEAADRQACRDHKPNNKIIKDPNKIQFMNAWDVAVFHGGPDGLLHRTPDAAKTEKTLLMRLDPASFWENIKRLDSLD